MRATHRIISSFVMAGFAASALTACSDASVDTDVMPVIAFSFNMVRPESDSAAAMRLAQDGKVPPGAIYRPFANEEGGLILEKRTRLKADCVKSANDGLHPVTDRPVVNFTFNKTCAKIFGEITSESIGKRFAVVLNGKILTAPTINSAITGGSGFIDGNFTVMEAQQLAAQVNAAAKKKVK